MSEEFVSEEVPGFGTVRARKGTSTIELAGAVNYWHRKSSTAWREGFLTATVALGTIGLVVAAYVTFF